MNHQRGAVLVLALIFLLLITAVAASLMTGGTFETVMVGNAQQREHIFRAAESSVEQVLPKQPPFSAARSSGQVYSVPASQLADPEPGMGYDVKIEYLTGASRPVPDNELGSFVYSMYQVQGTAYTTTDSTSESGETTKTENGRMKTQLVQGLGRMEPNQQE